MQGTLINRSHQAPPLPRGGAQCAFNCKWALATDLPFRPRPKKSQPRQQHRPRLQQRSGHLEPQHPHLPIRRHCRRTQENCRGHKNPKPRHPCDDFERAAPRVAPRSAVRHSRPCQGARGSRLPRSTDAAMNSRKRWRHPVAPVPPHARCRPQSGRAPSSPTPQVAACRPALATPALESQRDTSQSQTGVSRMPGKISHATCNSVIKLVRMSSGAAGSSPSPGT